MVLAHHSQARREVLKSLIKAFFAHQVTVFLKWLGQDMIKKDQLIGRIQLCKRSIFYFPDRVANTTEGDGDDYVMENKYRTQTA